ncbi:hypothetical protein [Neobacillus drentensis]|uniref:hypothetical protein n=1 Tax=Neobacillus drentensis TaxID=220684 RepID=UPI003000C1D2
MQIVIWALGSMFVLMLFISCLQLGLTFKGKLILVIISFLLALGGVAALASFPLWQTALLMGILSFFIAYFMDNRIGKLLYKANPVKEETIENIVNRMERIINVESVQLNDELPTILDSSLVNLEKVTDIEVKQPESITDKEIELVGNLEILDEDISFLLERNRENDVEIQIRENELEIGYLSDLERLLAFEEEKTEDVDDLIEEIPDLTENVVKPGQFEIEEDSIEDSLFDFMLAPKEAASGEGDILEEIKPTEQISLQK